MPYRLPNAIHMNTSNETDDVREALQAVGLNQLQPPSTKCE